MKLTFWGAARNVTGSMHLLELQNGKKLLLDCGLVQGRRAEANAINGTFPAEASAIDAVLLSHAHIDHSGMLPGLYRAGFRGRSFATHATYDLCALMLMDSAYIQQSAAVFYNKKFRKQGSRRSSRCIRRMTPSAPWSCLLALAIAHLLVRSMDAKSSFGMRVISWGRLR